MSARDPSDTTREASRLIDRQGGFTQFIQNSVLGGIILAAAYQIQELIGSLGETILRPLEAFAGALAELVDSTLGSGTDILDAGAETAAGSFLEGTASLLGPAAWPAAVLTVMAGLWVFSETWQRIDLSPWNFLQDIRQ